MLVEIWRNECRHRESRNLFSSGKNWNGCQFSWMTPGWKEERYSVFKMSSVKVRKVCGSHNTLKSGDNFQWCCLWQKKNATDFRLSSALAITDWLDLHINHLTKVDAPKLWLQVQKSVFGSLFCFLLPSPPHLLIHTLCFSEIYVRLIERYLFRTRSDLWMPRSF